MKLRNKLGKRDYHSPAVSGVTGALSNRLAHLSTPFAGTISGMVPSGGPKT